MQSVTSQNRHKNKDKNPPIAFMILFPLMIPHIFQVDSPQNPNSINESYENRITEQSSTEQIHRKIRIWIDVFACVPGEDIV